MELRDLKNVHLIGSAGVSMQALEQVLRARGVRTSGCDAATGGHDPSHITSDLDMVLYSSAITPRSPGYPELQQARKLKIPVHKRAWLVGRLMQEQGKFGIAIAGIHGKSTTTAMVGQILEAAGKDPLVLGFEFRLGKGDYVVAEADEFDRSFLAFAPRSAIVLNIEAEHLDYFANGLPEIIRAFREFVKLVPSTGVLVVNKDDKNCVAVAKSARCKVKYVSVNEPWPGLKLNIWGSHNLFNATAAARLCHELGVPSKTIVRALNSFTGIKRRMEHKATIDGIELYDDYAHHPTEIKATLRAARQQFGDRRIIVIFQPHQYSRTTLLFDDFAQSFDDADHAIVVPIYAVAGRDERKNVSSQDLAAAIKKPKAQALTDDEALKWLQEHAQSGDLVITMGAGPIDKLGERWTRQRN